MTAQAAESDRVRCLESGMDAYVTKPVHVPELMRMIEIVVPDSAVPGGNFMNGNVTSGKTSMEVATPATGRIAALSRVGGDVELLKEVVELFLDDYPSTFEKIRGAVASRDATALEHHAHSLKGSVSTFGQTARLKPLLPSKSRAAAAICLARRKVCSSWSRRWKRCAPSWSCCRPSSSRVSVNRQRKHAARLL